MTTIQSAPDAVAIGDLLVREKLYYRVLSLRTTAGHEVERLAPDAGVATCKALKDSEVSNLVVHLIPSTFIGSTKRKHTPTWQATTAPELAPAKKVSGKGPRAIPKAPKAPKAPKETPKAPKAPKGKMLESIVEDIHALADTTGKPVSEIVAALLERTFDESWRIRATKGKP